MPLQFLRARKMRTRNSGLADGNGASAEPDFAGVGVGDEAEADLPSAGELNIHLCEQLRIQKSPMLDAQAAVHSKACAQGIQAVLGAGVS